MVKTDLDVFREVLNQLGLSPDDELQDHDGNPWFIFEHSSNLSSSWHFKRDGSFWCCGTKLYCEGVLDMPLEISMANLKTALEERLTEIP